MRDAGEVWTECEVGGGEYFTSDWNRSGQFSEGGLLVHRSSAAVPPLTPPLKGEGVVDLS